MFPYLQDLKILSASQMLQLWPRRTTVLWQKKKSAPLTKDSLRWDRCTHCSGQALDNCRRSAPVSRHHTVNFTAS